MVTSSEAVAVVMSDRAVADYTEIRDRAVTCFQNGDKDREPIDRFMRVRSILGDLKNRAAAKFDQPLINELSWLLNRSESGTYVYYVRVVELSSVIVVHLCEGMTDIYPLLPEIIYAGQTEILTALGINPPPFPRTSLLIN